MKKKKVIWDNKPRDFTEEARENIEWLSSDKGVEWATCYPRCASALLTISKRILNYEKDKNN